MAGFFGVWNMYNRVWVYSMTGDDTNTWTLAAGTTTTMRVSFISGLAEDIFYASYACPCGGSSGGIAGCGVGVDSTTPLSGRKAFVNSTTSSSISGGHAATYLGFHFLQAMEWALTAGTASCSLAMAAPRR